MAKSNSPNIVLASVLLGTAAAVVGVFLYRRSGRNWQEDVKMAKDWMGDRVEDVEHGAEKGRDKAKELLQKTDKASRDLLANAKELGSRAKESVSNS